MIARVMSDEQVISNMGQVDVHENDDVDDHQHNSRIDTGEQPHSTHSSRKQKNDIPRFKHNPLKRDPSASSTVKYRPASGTNSSARSPKRLSSPTKSVAPKFDSQDEMERRKQIKEKKAMEEKVRTGQLNTFRNNQRSKLKQGYELEREMIIAQEELYKKQRAHQWKKRMAKSPFAVDLVADTERIQEEFAIRRLAEARKKQMEAKKLNELKASLIMNQLLESQQKQMTPHMIRRAEVDGL